MSHLILSENHVTAYRIICGDPSDPAVGNAAAELASYFTKITGAEISVVSPDVPAAEYEIVVGIAHGAESIIADLTALGEDGFVIRAVGKTLYLTGYHGRGTLYAVYEFLERFAGCRFYASYFEKIPSLDAFTIPADTDVRETPVFSVRNTFWADYTHNDSFCAKRKANGRKFTPIAPEWGGSSNWAGPACHTLFDLAEMDRADGHINREPCLCDEQVYETVLKNVRARLDAHPGARFLSISQNDSDARGIGCMCDKCKALLEKTGSYAGSYILFVNRIADAIRDDYPDVTIHTFAYRFTRKAPIGVRPAPNVTVEMCTIEGCFRHPLDECDAIDDPYMKSDTFPVLVRKWSALSETLSIWDYTTDFAHYSLTFPNFGVLRQNVRLFAENNAKFIFEQGAYTSRNGEFCELRGYLFSKLLWNPYMTEEEYRSLADEFIGDWYGAGADAVREYLTFAHTVTKDHHMTVYDHPTVLYPNETVTHHADGDIPPLTPDDIRDYRNTDFSPYLFWYTELIPNPILPRGYALFSSALDLESDPVLREHIETSALQVQYLQSYFLRQLYDTMRANLSRVLSAVGCDDARKAEILAYVMTDKEVDYRAFNERLYDEMLAHNCTDIREGFRLSAFDKKNLHFENTALGWV